MTEPIPRSTFDVEELTPLECWTALSADRVGRLAVCIDGRPQIFPVNFVVDDRSIVFRTAEGTKLSATIMAEVAFETDGYDPVTRQATSVVATGWATEVTDPAELQRVSTLPLFPWHVAPKGHFLRIAPSAVSGRRFRAGYVS